MAGAALMLLLPRGAPGQRSPGGQVATFTATAGEVLFDMTITDRHNRPVENLRAGDVEILDNGVPQKLTSFRLISHAAALPAGAGPIAAASRAPVAVPSPFVLRRVNLAVLIFGDPLDPAAAAESRRGAIRLVTGDLGPNDYVAVYRLDLAAQPLQNFTADRAAAARAIAEATAPSARRFADITPRAADAANPPIAAHAPPGGPASGASGALAAASTVEKDLQWRASTSEAASDTLTSLLAIVRRIAAFPGRKTIFYFSQFFPVDAGTAHLLKAVIREAQRGEISFYTVDPGLSFPAENGEMASQLTRAGAISQTEAQNDLQHTAVTPQQAYLSDTTENVQYSSKGRLEDLADSTGGRFLENANELEPQLREVAEEMEEHYELTWRPTSGWDGKYHSIVVKLRRRGLAVRARPGYEASPASGTSALNQPVPAFEAPLLALFDRWPAPAGLSFEQAALLFPADPRAQTTAVLLSAPLAQLACQRRRGGATCRLAVLALIRDERGAMVGKWSQNAELHLPLGPRPAEFVFERMMDLPPGFYHLLGAIYQSATGKGAVRRTLLYVPAALGLRISSIVTLAGAMPLDAHMPAQIAGDPNPLHFAGLRLIPALGEPLSREAGKLTLFFVVYLPAGAKATARIVFSRGGKVVARAQEALPPPDVEGRVIMTPAFAMRNFQPGEYQVAVRIAAGNLTVSRAGHFAIAAH